MKSEHFVRCRVLWIEGIIGHTGKRHRKESRRGCACAVHTTMNRLTRTLTGLLLVSLVAAACGGEEQSGVNLQVAGETRPTVTPASTVTPVSDQGPASLPGRLLILKGQQFQVFDFATGDLIPLGDVSAFSPASFDDARTLGVFVAFPNFGVVDLATNQVREIRNTASNPTGIGVSPDGVWMAVLTGQLSIRLQLLATDGSSTQNVANNSGGGGLNWTWTPDSRLIWWQANPDQPRGALMIFDSASGESSPVGDADLAVNPPGFMEVSPDGTRAANVPVAAVPPGQDNAACFDSYVELYQAPFTTQNFDADGRTIYTEAGLIASSPHWLTNELLLFVKVGTGTCGTVSGVPSREIMLLDTSQSSPRPQLIAGPLGNADDPNDRAQQFGRFYGHLYAAAPGGQYVAWVGGGRQAGETTVQVTDVQTGSTQTVLRFTTDDAQGAADFIEHTLIRQVVWLE